MDRRLILAVAGSGKTTYLINRLDLEHRFLIVTYTDNNYAHLRKSVINKFGYEPTNITLLTYFQFLLRVCFRPFLKDKAKPQGITYKMPESKTLRLSRNNSLFYMTRGGFLYHNRIAKLCQEQCANSIRARIEKFYDCFMIDEVQDLGGHDFNLVQAIMPQKIDCLMVGDFFQHTYDTSKDGNTNASLYKDFAKYKKHWSDIGIVIDDQTLSNSHRCSQNVCDFVQQNLGIAIASHRQDVTQIHYIDNEQIAETLYHDGTRVKLFYNNSDRYECYSLNWGASKGLDKFQDVCIVMNKKTLEAFHDGELNLLSPATKNKLYVACTRAKGDIYLIPHTFIDKFKRI